jgi:hypothetical protein
LLRKIVSLKLFFQFALAKPLDFQNDALEISRRFFVLISCRSILSGGATTYLLRSPLQAGT